MTTESERTLWDAVKRSTRERQANGEAPNQRAIETVARAYQLTTAIETYGLDTVRAAVDFAAENKARKG